MLMKDAIPISTDVIPISTSASGNPSQPRYALAAGAMPSTRTKTRCLLPRYSSVADFGRCPKPNQWQPPSLAVCKQPTPSNHARTPRRALRIIFVSEARCLGLKAKIGADGRRSLDLRSSRRFCKACETESIEAHLNVPWMLCKKILVNRVSVSRS